MKKVVFIITTLLAILASGCVERTVYVRSGPPPLKTEIVTVAPYTDAVWVPGHWKWGGHYRGYVWVSGHWRRHTVLVPVATTPVVAIPVQEAPAATVATVETDTLTINIPNSKGSYTSVTLVKRGTGYVGPQGEYYEGHPTVDQLKTLYGK